MGESARRASPSPDVDQAVTLVAEAIGELMEFWSFKPSMGRVWAVLYLSEQPLSAEQICEKTGLSAGSVSMTLNELRLWGVVGRAPLAEGATSGRRRKKLYRAETDIWGMVTRVFRDRELKQVRRTVALLERAQTLLDGLPDDSEEGLRAAFVAARVKRLLELSHTGERLLERLAEAGELDLKPIRNWLDRRRTG